mmetsp:Transcript_41718/g.63734  ORF Transcript_41718/g.63734 Transcript_41718/m.63734 type:complete len:145 (-) Transcript_41718:555-989(-)
MLMVASSQLTALYLSSAKPFESVGLGRIELFNEVTIVLASCSLSLFSDYVPVADEQYSLGWGVIAFLSANMLINIGYTIYLSMSAQYHKLRRWYIKRTAQAKPLLLQNSTEDGPTKKRTHEVAPILILNLGTTDSSENEKVKMT